MKFLLFSILYHIVAFQANGQSTPVIVELFTSQGCSSCPAADKNLTEILKKAESENQPVYGLSFHVDYWNYIGWKDPYSQGAFTERQKNYSMKLGLDGIYTPQMIVNGQHEFVGSNKNGIENSIREGLRQTDHYKIEVSFLRVSKKILRVSYNLDNDPSGEALSVALVQKSIENFVPKGENRGKKLHHDNVVLFFKVVPLQRKSELDISLPELSSQNISVILYVQDMQYHVVAATMKSLN